MTSHCNWTVKDPAKFKTAFASDYADALHVWGKRLASGDGLIVAISRKAPRILELGVREGLIPDSVLDRVTSERGLRAMLGNPVGEPLKVYDDIVIVGSTFKRIGKIAGELCGDEHVVGLPFARSTSADANNLQIVGDAAPITLSNDVCSSFVLSEIAAFGFLDKPYDVEHPILYVDLDHLASPDKIERSLQSWTSKNACQMYATPRQLTDANGELITHLAWTILEADPQSPGHIRKLRCYLDVGRWRLALVPIQTRVGTVQDFEAAVERSPKALVECWNAIEFGIGDTESPLAHTNRSRSEVAWASYLLDLDALGAVLSRLRLHLVEDHIVPNANSFYFDLFDIQLLTGVGVGDTIKARLEAFVNSIKFASRPTIPASESWKLAPVIPDKYRDDYETTLAELLHGVVDITEALEAVFKAQHVAVELQSRMDEPGNPQRLEFGVPFSYLLATVKKALVNVDLTSFHKALDTLIDSGVIVPRFLPQDVNGVEVWCRTFRVGEALPTVRGHVTKQCFKALSGVYGNTDLREVLTEKFLVLVCEFEGLFRTSSLATARDIRRDFHLYGARPAVIAGARSEWLMDFAIRRRILQRVERDGEPFYSLDPRAQRYFRDDENPLSNEARHRLAALARWTRAANDAAGLGVDFLTAITTVESPWAYRKALEAEIMGWLHHEVWGIEAALHALDDLATKADSKTKDHAGRTLSQLANWVAQARVKHRLRKSIPGFVERADTIWPRESYDEISTTWRNIVRPKYETLSERDSQPSNVVNDTLLPTLQVLNRLTSLLRNILSEFAGIKDERSIPTKTSVTELQVAIDDLKPHIKDNFKEARDALDAVSSAKNLNEAIAAMRKPACVIADAAECVLALYPDFTDEAMIPLRPGLYILLWDIRGSTSGEDRDKLTRRIEAVNQSIHNSFHRRLLHFDPEATTDENAAVCYDFETAIAVARAVINGFSPILVRIGCDSNADGALSHGQSSKRLGGRAFEYTARTMQLFSEIGKFPDRWILDKGRRDNQAMTRPTEPPETSYLLLSEQAYRSAADGPHARFLRYFTEMPGSYRARVHGAYPRRIYLWSFDPKSAGVQLPLIDESK